ncbi:MAG: DEAD/DEAH box helicase family protein [Polyangiaceae bacterium]|nr:DEAD/DEAH box helicase family protein [Polyangiaceae bacterium]
MAVQLRFREGTLELENLPADGPGAQLCRWDERAHLHRAPALAYAPLVRELVAGKVEFHDAARNYSEVELKVSAEKEPRTYQREALAAWRASQGRGVVVLPTGAGKSFVAVMAMAQKQRATLVVAPTLDLVRQWHYLLSTTFGIEVGLLGGGEHHLLPVTVTTYDSAYLHMSHLGNRFGLVVFDEVHHLPGESYALTARMCLAPYRLGLTATPERSDGREVVLEELIGPQVYTKAITELSGEYLADYQTARIIVQLSEEERAEYDGARGTYLTFIRQQGIQMSSPRGFAEFIMRASRNEAGRQALDAYRRQKALALAASAKQRELERLLHQHRRDRVIIFTQDNATAYEVSRRFLVPVITHQTKLKERVAILSGFSEGRFRAIVTSKVLNEGVDVPTANVAIIVSGSGSVMEHVQRLGRILRPQKGKEAMLYEIVSEGTSEASTSERRREHDAYRYRRPWRRSR